MENTYSDLRDCFDNWEDSDSETEIKYRNKILKLCKQIIDCYDENQDDE
jgi:hypothetical protein